MMTSRFLYGTPAGVLGFHLVFRRRCRRLICSTPPACAFFDLAFAAGWRAMTLASFTAPLPGCRSYSIVFRRRCRRLICSTPPACDQFVPRWIPLQNLRVQSASPRSSVPRWIIERSSTPMRVELWGSWLREPCEEQQKDLPGVDDTNTPGGLSGRPFVTTARILPAGLCHSSDYEHPLVLPQLRHL